VVVVRVSGYDGGDWSLGESMGGGYTEVTVVAFGESEGHWFWRYYYYM